MPDFTINEATTPEDIDAVRNLCWAYRDFLMAASDRDRQITETFYPIEKYRRLMDDLPAIHAAPRGSLLLARDTDGTAMGCGMTHPLDTETSEIKRVFVTDTARGRGMARALCIALVRHAREAGFSRIVLDTFKSLTAAQALYTQLGFAKRGPYQPIPDDVLPDLLFYELPL